MELIAKIESKWLRIQCKNYNLKVSPTGFNRIVFCLFCRPCFGYNCKPLMKSDVNLHWLCKEICQPKVNFIHWQGHDRSLILK